jgi:hypothetical protein
MHRAEVRIIENQFESSTPVNISDWERNQLLLKYGYSQNQLSPNQTHNNQPSPTSDLSYGELMALEDRKYYDSLNQYKQDPKPQSYTIDNDRIQYNESRHSSMDVDGLNFGLEIQIFSDMKINR